jgi:putative transferase (TIGR04331 family)
MSDTFFLGLTGLSEFWDKDQEILFLGTWCLKHENKHEWEHLNYSVLPCPWNDRERFYSAIEYLDDFYERILYELTDYLNTVHCVSFSKRYWRILLGPWLLQYLYVLYDRYVLLEEVLKTDKIPHTFVLSPESFQTPVDFRDAQELIFEDFYNLQLFSQLLREMKFNFPEKHFQAVYENHKAKRSSWLSIAKRRVKENIYTLSQIVSHNSSGHQKIAIGNLGCSHSKMGALIWKTRFRAVPLFFQDPDWPSGVPLGILDHFRLRFNQIPTRTEFERICIGTFSKNFPFIYLEGFQDVRNEAINKRVKDPSAIFAGSDWYANELFKFFAAECAENGTKLFAVQHGGGYGTDRYAPAERYERSFADYFMAWGWATETDIQLWNLPSLKISDTISCAKTPLTSILFVLTAHPRYLYRFQSTPVGSQWNDYWNWQRSFTAVLSSNLRKSIIFRSPNIDLGNCVYQRIREISPESSWDDGAQSFAQCILKCRLVVIDNRQTTFLEALAANVPTILFWDPNRWECRDEAQPYFERLKDVGILWERPEEAANKVTEVYSDIDTWWLSSDVQDARTQFVRKFAFNCRDWVKMWGDILTEEYFKNTQSIVGRNTGGQ